MKLYLKIFKFVTPYWKAIIIALLLTVTYVGFNNISLWVSVDFVREIFSPEYIEGSQGAPSQETKPDPVDKLAESSTGTKLYRNINAAIKSFLIQDDRYDTLLVICLVILFSFILKNIALYLKKVVLNYVELNIIVSLRNSLHESILYLPLSFFEKRHSGDLTSVVFNDVNAVRHVLHNSFGKMFLSPVQIITNILILLNISWRLSLITFLVIPVSTFVIVKIGQAMRRRSRKVFRQVADVLATFQEAVSAIRIVKAFTNEKKETEKFHQTNRLYFKKLFRANKLKFATSPINEVLLVFVLIFLLWYGGNQVYSNTGLNAEDFLKFLVFLFTMFQPIKDLSGVNNIIQTGLAAAERIFAVIDTPREVYEKPDSIKLEQFDNSITFDNVSFKYNSDQDFVLKNIDLEIKKGEMIAFVGASGAGKTTLINLVPRFYNPDSGRLLIDGDNVQNFTLNSLRKKMSIVTQDIILFNDTIRANIAYGLEDVSEQDIKDAAQAANAWEFIEQEEMGLDAHIGEKGTKMSGGQKQRISIARAILKNPPILILDEATSSLDTESERLVQDAVSQLMKNRTVLVIAHRLSTIKDANRIVVLNRGGVESIGSHDDLLSRSPIYKNLYENQLLTEQVS